MVAPVSGTAAELSALLLIQQASKVEFFLVTMSLERERARLGPACAYSRDVDPISDALQHSSTWAVLCCREMVIRIDSVAGKRH